jgi:hypothetical protein
MTPTEIEKRLTRVEAELAILKAQHTAPHIVKSHPIQALEKIHGTFENDDAFKEAMRLGRKWRESQRPRKSARAAKAKRK